MIRLAAVEGRGRRTHFSVSHRPPETEGWLELLASGLTFDLSGLSPAPGAIIPAKRHVFALADSGFAGPLEAVRLEPGPHLAGGGGLLPVVRAMVGLAAALAELPGVLAIAWHPAGSWMEPAYFVRTVTAWLEGGAFPALGLSGLARDSDGALRSEGLAFFTGQELRIEAGIAADSAQLAKFAVRLIHRLVESGSVAEALELVGEDGKLLRLEPSADGRTLQVSVPEE